METDYNFSKICRTCLGIQKARTGLASRLSKHPLELPVPLKIRTLEEQLTTFIAVALPNFLPCKTHFVVTYNSKSSSKNQSIPRQRRLIPLLHPRRSREYFSFPKTVVWRVHPIWSPRSYHLHATKTCLLRNQGKRRMPDKTGFKNS